MRQCKLLIHFTTFREKCSRFIYCRSEILECVKKESPYLLGYCDLYARHPLEASLNLIYIISDGWFVRLLQCQQNCAVCTLSSKWLSSSLLANCGKMIEFSFSREAGKAVQECGTKLDNEWVELVSSQPNSTWKSDMFSRIQERRLLSHTWNGLQVHYVSSINPNAW